jgi:hypothetical protein
MAKALPSSSVGVISVLLARAWTFGHSLTDTPHYDHQRYPVCLGAPVEAQPMSRGYRAEQNPTPR